MAITEKEKDVLVRKLVSDMVKSTDRLLVRDDATLREQMSMIYLAVYEYLGGVYAAGYLVGGSPIPIGEKISGDMAVIAEMVTVNALELMDEATAPTVGGVH